jgi:ligand-binding sensor domain-containing protein
MRRIVVFAITALAVSGCSTSTAPGTGGVALWVANYGGTILGYAPTQLTSSTSAAPAVVLTRSDTNPGITFDARGNLWVSEPVNNAVVEYTADQITVSGRQTPNVTLTANAAGSLNGPIGLAFDAGGNLWIANVAGTVVEFTASQIASSGRPAPVVTLTGDFQSIQRPEHLTFDQGGNLWVAGIFSSALIEFTATQLGSSGSSEPSVTLSDTSAGNLLGIVTMAFDGAGDMWVANPNANQVVEFARGQIGISGSPAPAVRLTSTIYPQILAFDGHGNLWASGSVAGTVVEFAASQLITSGTPTPRVTISGASITGPVALAFTR